MLSFYYHQTILILHFYFVSPSAELYVFITTTKLQLSFYILYIYNQVIILWILLIKSKIETRQTVG